MFSFVVSQEGRKSPNNRKVKIQSVTDEDESSDLQIVSSSSNNVLDVRRSSRKPTPNKRFQDDDVITSPPRKKKIQGTVFQ